MAKRVMIQVTPEFNAWVESHGRYGETKEQIIIRLIGEDMYKPSGDRPTKKYSKEDVDSRKTKKQRRKDGD